MRILLDECLPRRLKRELIGHDARTVPEMGWASRRNGDLLRLAVGEFDAFLTVDRKLQHQQDLSAFNIAVVVLIADGNTLNDLQPLMAKVLQLLPNAADHRVRAFRPPRQRASAAGRVRRRQQIDT